MSVCELIILTFIVTGLWDVVLRVMSENYKKLPNMMKYDFVRILQPYFKKHTLLAAALIAGFVGAITQYVILNMVSFPSDIMDVSSVVTFLLVSFIISGLFGIIMKATKLFPHLDEYYYKPLGLIRSIYHDGISGLVVQITLIFMLSFNRYV